MTESLVRQSDRLTVLGRLRGRAMLLEIGGLQQRLRLRLDRSCGRGMRRRRQVRRHTRGCGRRGRTCEAQQTARRKTADHRTVGQLLRMDLLLRHQDKRMLIIVIAKKIPLSFLLSYFFSLILRAYIFFFSNKILDKIYVYFYSYVEPESPDDWYCKLSHQRYLITFRKSRIFNETADQTKEV